MDTGRGDNDVLRDSIRYMNPREHELYVRGPKWLHPPILTSVFLGTQLVWSVEMAYASPYLLSLGLSKAAAAIVFIAAPLSGLVVQPLVGAWADRNTSSYGRRRPFIVGGTALCALGMFGLSWARDLASSVGISGATIAIAVLSLYVLDFSINAVIAADRALIVDVLPAETQETANLWTSRAVGLGALAGFFVGNIDLPNTRILSLLGNSQLQILSAIVAGFLVLFHAIACLNVTERPIDRLATSSSTGLWQQMTGTISSLAKQTLQLPSDIKRICWILFCTWIGFFPVMFWGSLWISSIYRRELGVPSSPHEGSFLSIGFDEEATRAGSRALAWHAGVGFTCSVFLPVVVRSPEDPLERSSYRGLGRLTSKLKRLFDKLRIDLLTAWIIGHVAFACCVFSVWWIESYTFATLIYGILGFPSAMLHWAPFALLGEAILLDDSIPPEPESTAEQSPLLSPIDPQSRRSLEGHNTVKDKAGAVLGIANVFVVLPQFVVIGISTVIFAILEPNRVIVPSFEADGIPAKPTALNIIFTIGGFSALVACYLTTSLHHTRLKRLASDNTHTIPYNQL